MVVKRPHALAATHGLVTHASEGSYGIRLLTRKESGRSACVGSEYLSSDGLDVDVEEGSVRECRAYLAIELGAAQRVGPMGFAPAETMQFDGMVIEASAWREGWALWKSTWLRALVAAVPPRGGGEGEDEPKGYVVMWDAKRLTGEFRAEDVWLEGTDACNERMERERERANEALAAGSRRDSRRDARRGTRGVVGTEGCVVCGAAQQEQEQEQQQQEEQHGAGTEREADERSVVKTTRTTSKVGVETGGGWRVETTTESTTVTETTTVVTKYVTTTTRTTRVVVPVYPRGLVPGLQGLYGRCRRALGGRSHVVCGTCGVAVCVGCMVRHFPFEAQCEVIPRARERGYRWECAGCEGAQCGLGTRLWPRE